MRTQTSVLSIDCVNTEVQSSFGVTYLIYRLCSALMIFPLCPPPSHPFPYHTTHLSSVVSFPVLHIPPSLCSVILPLDSTCDFFYLTRLPPCLSTSTPPPAPTHSLCCSGRLLIAVSQYHGGRQRGCRSGGECSTRTAGSHSHIQP